MPGNSDDKAREGSKPGPHRDRRPGPHGSRPRGAGAGRGPGPQAKRGGKPPEQGAPRRPGAIRLARIGGNHFELVHPACVRETELDYEEGMEIWKAGDPEGARDALRYALAACRDHLWIHVALGRIALEEFRDPGLARGHFGYAVELCERAITPQFSGLLPADRRNNRPFYEAVDGLIRCLEALGRERDASGLRAMRDRLSGAQADGGRNPTRRPDPAV